VIWTLPTVLERRDGAFQIVRYLADLPPTKAVQAIRAGIGWDAKVAADLTHEPAPDPQLRKPEYPAASLQIRVQDGDVVGVPAGN
jgi:hypothetical protein